MSHDQQDMEKMQEAQDPLFGGNIKPMEEKRTKCLCCTCTRKRKIIIILICGMLLLYGIGLAIGLAVGLGNKSDENPPKKEKPTVKIPIGAVVSDHEACSEIGRDILERRGTAVDAAIATLICLGVRAPQSMGIGGGDFMVIYDKAEQKATYIDGREMAPHSVTDDIFDRRVGSNGSLMVVYDKRHGKVTTIDGSPIAPQKMTSDLYTRLTNQSTRAVKIGIPGELKAFKHAHNVFGHFPWEELFTPTIQMIRDGFPLSETTEKSINYIKQYYKMDNFTEFPLLCNIFCSDTNTGKTLKAGEIQHWPHLADTLQGIADRGPDYLYDGEITQDIVDEIQDAGGVLDLKDFVNNYKLLYGDALPVELGNYTLYTMPGATGGPLLALILNILKRFIYMWWDIDISNLSDRGEVYHAFIEAMKFADADRVHLEDPEFSDEAKKLIEKLTSDEYADIIRTKITDKTHEYNYYTDAARSFTDHEGTSHVSVLSPYGDAVSVTSTVNYSFGSKFASNSTGIIWNNELDDFSSTGTYNRIEPLKRPRSAMAPVIVVDQEGNVKLVTGAAGGSKITTTVAQIVAKVILLDVPLTEAIDDKRFNPVLAKSYVLLEKGFSEELSKELELRDHVLVDNTSPRFSIAQSILVESDTIFGYADPRKKPGKVSYVNKLVKEDDIKS